MFAKEITVLAVDDEPDVLSVTKLALRSMTVGGLPLNVYTATSKAEAIELLNGPLGSQVRGISRIAVAFIDVVMETDHAGSGALPVHPRNAWATRSRRSTCAPASPAWRPSAPSSTAMTSPATCPRWKRPRTSCTRWCAPAFAPRW